MDMYWKNGRVIIYEVPSEAREIMCEFFTGTLYIFSQQVLGHRQTIRSMGSTNIHVNDHLTQVPDKCFRHIHRQINHPQVIVEVGKTQTFPALHWKAISYFEHPSTVMVITMKKFENSSFLLCTYRRDFHDGKRMMEVISLGLDTPPFIALTFLARLDVSDEHTDHRGHFHVGDAVCNQPDMAEFQVVIPRAVWIDDVPPKFIHPDYFTKNGFDIVIDLFGIVSDFFQMAP